MHKPVKECTLDGGSADSKRVLGILFTLGKQARILSESYSSHVFSKNCKSTNLVRNCPLCGRATWNCTV